MGYQSTVDISRQEAIARILFIYGLVTDKNYRRIEEITSEDEDYYSLCDFVNCPEFINSNFGNKGCIVDINMWTNKMIEDVIDTPFFRISQLENYNVDD